MDRLQKLFSTQWELNDTVFKKFNLGETPSSIYLEASSGLDINANSSVRKWLSKYLIALKDEVRELEEELPWKWWSNDVLDMQNVRVEIIDILHFWISLALTAGLDADKVFDLYMQKNKVNLERLEKGYSKLTKDQNDCKGIK